MIEGATSRSLRIGKLGFTVYEMGRGPVVLCLHGFPDTPRTFRSMLPALARAGYRAVAPILRGYEPSSQPADGDYSLAALSEDVAALARELDTAPAHLLGHDWGASIAYAAAARFPQQWRSLTTIAVPHPAAFAAAMAGNYVQLKRSWYMFFFQQRGLAEAVVSAGDFAFLRELWRDWSPGWTPSAADLEAVVAAFRAPGVLESALSYYRTALDPTSPRASEAVAIWSGPIETPTLGLTGERDGCIGSEIFEAAMPTALFTKGVEVVRMRGVGHFLQLEDPDQTHACVLSFLAKH